MSGTKRPAADTEATLYVVEWECDACHRRLGRVAGLVPCVNTRCLEHRICYACTKSLPRVDGVALCPVCNTPCGRFLPLAGLIDTSKDPAAAQVLQEIVPADMSGNAVLAPPSQPKFFTSMTPSAIPETVVPESIPPWNAPNLCAARVANLAEMIRKRKHKMHTKGWQRSYTHGAVVPAYDVPYVLRDAHSRPLDMRRQTLLHAIQEAAVATVRPRYPEFVIKALQGIDSDRPGVYYMLISLERVNAPEPGTVPRQVSRIASLPVTPADDREPWNSERRRAARKQYLIDMLEEFQSRRIDLDAPLDADDVAWVYAKDSPDWECSDARVVEGCATRNPMLRRIAEDTVQSVAPLYPNLCLVAAPMQAVPDGGPYQDAYMRVDIRPASATAQTSRAPANNRHPVIDLTE